MSTTLYTLDPTCLNPLFPPHARTEPMQFTVSRTVARGQVLGQITSSGKGDTYAPRNRVQQIKIVGTLTAGTWRISAQKADGSWVTTDAIAYNASATDIQNALIAVLGTAAVAVAIPTNYASGINVTFSGTGYTGVPQALMKVDDEGLTTATTSSVAETTSLTGVETAVAIAKYDFITDSSGNVIYTTTAGLTPSLVNPAQDTALVYKHGDFLVSALTGLDAAAVAALNATYRGVGAGQYIHIP